MISIINIKLNFNIMTEYYVNNDSSGNPNRNHEVHTSTCRYKSTNSINLGFHYSCYSAVLKAKNYYKDADGCYHCSNDCHHK